MTRKVFAKLLGLFLLLLVFHTVVLEMVFRHMVEQAAGGTPHRLLRVAIWSGVIALAVALPLAAWVSMRVASRLQRVVAFARQVADGDLSARLAHSSDDELSAMEAALNQTAERLDRSFAELESRRQELAAMLDSMQEAVVAVTAEGRVLWSNTVMRRIAGMQVRVGRPLTHSVRDPDLLACVKCALEERAARNGRASSLAPGGCSKSMPFPCPPVARWPYCTT